MKNLSITFPNNQSFIIPLDAVRNHRLAWYLREDANSDWWRSADHDRPGVLAMWPPDQMTWDEVVPHCTPTPRRDMYFTNCWSNKKATVQLCK